MKARITLLHAVSHDSRFGKFARKGQFVDTTDAGKIAYYQRQSEFSVSITAEPRAPKRAPESVPVAVAAEPAIERRPWNDKMNKADLLAEAKRRGIAVVDEDTKAAIVEMLTEDDSEED